VGLAQELLHITERAVARVDGGVVGDVVAIVLERRGVEGQQPERGDAEVLQVVQLLSQAAEVADAIFVAVVERPHVQLIDDRVFVPEWVAMVGRRHQELLVP
jgi:hypothetical protein